MAAVLSRNYFAKFEIKSDNAESVSPLTSRGEWLTTNQLKEKNKKLRA
jgi:hypothetical protein